MLKSRSLNLLITLLGGILLALAVSGVVLESSPSAPGVLLFGGLGLWAFTGGLTNLRARKADFSEGPGWFASPGLLIGWVSLLTVIAALATLGVWLVTDSSVAERLLPFESAVLLLASIAALVWLSAHGAAVLLKALGRRRRGSV